MGNVKSGPEEREVILTSAAPAPIGPYSQAIRKGGWLFCSGQIPLDPATGQIVVGDVRAQTEQVMKNLQAVLTAAGVGWSAVVKTTIFLQSMDDFPAVNEVYGRYVGEKAAPARSTVEVASLPKKARVEIEAVAITDLCAGS